VSYFAGILAVHRGGKASRAVFLDTRSGADESEEPELTDRSCEMGRFAAEVAETVTISPVRPIFRSSNRPQKETPVDMTGA
jgi:hypothetical protein